MAKNNNKKEEIMIAAKELFVRLGVDATSMDQIAKQVNITKATLYYYFSSKEELLNEVINKSISRLIENLIIQRNKSKELGPQYITQRGIMNFNSYIEERDVLRILLGQMLKKDYVEKDLKLFRNTILKQYEDELKLENNKQKEGRILMAGLMLCIFFVLKEDICKGMDITESEMDQLFEEYMMGSFINLGRSTVE